MEIKKYKREDSSLRILLHGPPKTGKTWFSLGSPSPLFFDFDCGLMTAIEKGVEPDYIAYDLSQPIQAWNSFVKDIKDAFTLDYQTIVIDSVTTLTDKILLPVALGMVGHKKIWDANERTRGPVWTNVRFMLEDIIVSATDLSRKHNKNFIMICHERVDKNEVTGEIMISPGLTGALMAMAGCFFDFVLHTKVKKSAPVPPSFKGKRPSVPFRYVIETKSRIYQTGTRVNLPDEIECEWEAFMKELKRKEAKNEAEEKEQRKNMA